MASILATTSKYFYDHVQSVTRRTIDQSADGKLRDRNAEESWALLEDLALYANESWNDPRDFAKPVKAISLPQDVPSTFDCRLIELKNQVQCLMEAHLALTQPTQVNKITSSCEIFSGPYDTQYCMENPKQAFVEYASSRTDEAGVKKIEKFMRYPDTEDLEPLDDCKFSEPLTKNASFHTLKFVSPNPQSSLQVLPLFEVYTPPLTYPKEVEKALGTPIEVEPLDETQRENLCLNTCNHDLPLTPREVPSFYESEPQPQSLTNFPSLDISLGKERGLEPPIKPHSPDSFRMEVVDNLTIHTPPSPHVASFHIKDLYCYFHPCIDDPQKLYGFKLGLLGHSGSLCVDFSNLEIIEDDWELESKEVSFLGRGLNLPVRPKEVEKVWIKETHHLEHIIQQPIFSM
ncbi:hypothetical protein Tco_1253465 [Tanacetum coccineum]